MELPELSLSSSMGSAITVSLLGTDLYVPAWSFINLPNKGNAYYDFFPSLASSGLEVRTFDQRYVYEHPDG
jgi:hypothetical protein